MRFRSVVDAKMGSLSLGVESGDKLRVGDNAGEPRRDNFVLTCPKWNDAMMLFDAKMGVGRKRGHGAEMETWVLQVRFGAMG